MASSEIKMSMSLATAKVTTALGKLKTNISNFAKSANEKLGNFAKKVSLGLAGAFAISAKSALEYGKEIKNLAALSDSTVEEFQKVAIAAKTVGIEQDKLADQFKDFGERVGQIVRGEGGELKPFFEGVGRDAGVTAEAMAKLSGPEAFGLFYRTLEEAGVRGEALSSYLEDVGSDMTALIPLYKDNAKVLNQLGDAAEKNGEIMSQATADSLSKAQIAIDNFKRKAVIKVGELISGESNHAAFKILTARFGALMAKVGEMMANAMIYGVKALSAGMSASATVFKTTITNLFKMVGPSLKLAIGEAINPLIRILDMVFKTKTPLIDVEKAKADLIGLSLTAQKSFGEVFDANMEDMGEWRVSTKKQQDAYTELADTLQRNLDASREIAKVTKKEVPVVKEITETMRLQAELKEAIEHGDVERVKLAEDALKRENDILKVVNDQGVSYDEAANYIDNIIAREKERAAEKNTQAAKEEAQAAKEEAQAQKMINMERDLLNAVLSGDEIAARAAQKKIDLEMRAMEIMEQLKVSYEEAYAIAQKLARIEAGPDLNNSGFTTSFEQREFNRQQKQRDKALDNARRQEERDRKEQGANIPNVSRDRRKTDFGKVSMLIDKDKSQRIAENKKIGNMVRGGMDRAEAEAQFAAARAQRARGIEEARAAQKKFGIEDPKAKAKEEADAKAKADWENEFDRVQGKPGGPDGKQPDPKKPDQAIAEGLQMQAGKLDQQIAILSEISASLKC